MFVLTRFYCIVTCLATPIQRTTTTTALDYNNIETTEQTVTDTDIETATNSVPTHMAINLISTKQVLPSHSTTDIYQG